MRLFKYTPIRLSPKVIRFIVNATPIALVLSGSVLAGLYGAQHGNLRSVYLSFIVIGFLVLIGIGIDLYNRAASAHKANNYRKFAADEKLIAELCASASLLSLTVAIVAVSIVADQGNVEVRLKLAEEAMSSFSIASPFCKQNGKKDECTYLNNHLTTYRNLIAERKPEADIEKARIIAANGVVALQSVGASDLYRTAQILNRAKIDSSLAELIFPSAPLIVFVFSSLAVTRKVTLALFEKLNGP